MDGNTHIDKARLMAKGYTQTPGINYEETFSPVEEIRAIRILIAIAAYYDYEIWQMDVKSAFLNGYLNEESVKTYLGKCFAMKDLGKAAYILGIKIYIDRSKRLIGLCQSACIKKNLKRYCMKNSKCRRSIMYDVRCTRPDVAFTQNTGYVFILNGGVVDWKNAKKSIFATSSAEGEYIATVDASKEAVWVRKFIFGLGVVPTIEEPISMYCDNTRAITIANEFGIMKGARHFRAKVHYL
uniref:Reverse transcriptase Ty1/copia-type domain-containing protein n=1 Tax=Tanacetum cinerariifolium TaxID=118510 RepID=A0A6L2J3C1_TANCI|nr:hypothetical protein [Tanacetum cinerariifolium]